MKSEAHNAKFDEMMDNGGVSSDLAKETIKRYEKEI